LRQWTDFQRVALALYALGLDAADYEGYDLTAAFRDFVPTDERHALNRSILADIFALAVLDASGYSFLVNILSVQRADGTWSLNPAQPTSDYDIDITAMAVQALAPYYLRGDALAVHAVENALAWLYGQAFPDPESTAQMVVALAALGGNYINKAEYYVHKLLYWYNPEAGGFIRANNPDAVNPKATVQAAYALAFYHRTKRDM
jgi:hypothetical protein